MAYLNGEGSMQALADRFGIKGSIQVSRWVMYYNPDYHNLSIGCLLTTGLRVDYLFLNSHSDDGKLHLRALDNRLRKIQEILYFDEDAVRSPHDYRRTYASIQYLHDVDIKTIQAQLGHSKVTQTWDYVRDVVDLMTRKGKLENGCILA